MIGWKDSRTKAAAKAKPIVPYSYAFSRPFSFGAGNMYSDWFIMLSASRLWLLIRTITLVLVLRDSLENCFVIRTNSAGFANIVEHSPPRPEEEMTDSGKTESHESSDRPIEYIAASSSDVNNHESPFKKAYRSNFKFILLLHLTILQFKPDLSSQLFLKLDGSLFCA